MFLVAASHLSERSRKHLERLGINYADLAGHAWKEVEDGHRTRRAA